MKDSSKLLMSDSFYKNKMETIINGGFKSSSICLWSDYGYSESLSCDFPVEKSNVPKLAILYINQAYFNNKYGKKIYYYDLLVVGQATPMLNPPEDLLIMFQRMK